MLIQLVVCPEAAQPRMSRDSCRMSIEDKLALIGAYNKNQYVVYYHHSRCCYVNWGGGGV